MATISFAGLPVRVPVESLISTRLEASSATDEDVHDGLASAVRDIAAMFGRLVDHLAERGMMTPEELQRVVGVKLRDPLLTLGG